MKLVIQIPSYNEEQGLAETIRLLPRSLPRVDCIEVLVIDDGSSDRTAEVARAAGADHIIRHKKNRGLAAAFQSGIDAALELGADIIVNTDADNQYPGSFIAALIAPILDGGADYVIADRQMSRLTHLSRTHRLLQRIGSAAVSRISGIPVPDAPSGFRAITREAALRIEVLTDYTYTLETLIQAAHKGLRLAWVPVDVNPPMRASRLKRSEAQYVRRSAVTMLRLYALYKPLRTFVLLALPFMLAGLGLWGRYVGLVLSHAATRGSNIQSVVVGAALLLISLLLVSLGILGDILARNRTLTDRTLELTKRSLFRGSESPRVVDPGAGADQREPVRYT